MAVDNIIGRQKEKLKLDSLFQSEDSCFFLIYGRRRIGKTHLISEFFKDRPDTLFLSFKAEYELRKSPEIQAYNLRKEIDNFLQSFQIDISTLLFRKEEPLWSETFNYLEKAINILRKKEKDKKIVIFFDELPWFYSKKDKKEFIGILSNFWTKFILQHPEKTHLKVFASGSATRTIFQDLIGARGGLFQSKDKSVYKLNPFNLVEVKNFLIHKGIKLPNEEIIKLYFAIGGVADYLDQFSSKHTVDSFINEFYFKNENNYNKGLSEFLKSSFDDHPSHRLVLDAISLTKKGITQQEIQGKTKISSRDLAKILLELSETGLISKNIELAPSSKINRKSKNKPQIESKRRKPHNIRYKLFDEMVLFNYYWINGNQYNSQSSWNPSSPLHKEWKGRMFETICFKNVELIVAAKKYGAQTLYDTHYWANEKADIDFLIDRSDNAIDIFEMKCYEKGFNMEKNYLQDLFNKREELVEWIQSFKNKNLTPYKLKSILITIVSFTDATIPKECQGTDKVADTIIFSNLF